MPRKGPVTKRDVLPDPVYGSKLLTRFINKIMLDGKKGVAERIVYDAFDLVRAKTGKDPLEVFDAAMKKCYAAPRSTCPPRRWCKLPGSGRSTC